MRFVALILIALVVGSGCSAESGPVSIPVPFSGSLLELSNLLVSKGDPLASGTLCVNGSCHPTGVTWLLVDSRDQSVGRCSLDPTTMSQSTFTGPTRIFTVNIQCEFGEFENDLCVSDCSELRVNGAEFHDFDSLVNSVSFDLNQAAPDEPDAKIVTTQGVASGFISNGTGKFVTAIGQVVNLWYLFGWVEHSDQVRTLFRQELCQWFVHGGQPLTPAVLAGDVGANERVLSASFVYGETDLLDPSKLAPGAIAGTTAPLFCIDEDSGRVFECGFEEESLLDLVPLSENANDLIEEVRMCVGSSCLTVHNAHFEGHKDPEIIDPIRTFLQAAFPDADAKLGENPIAGQITLRSHDPIQCAEATGIFQIPACEGRLKLDWRAEAIGSSDFENPSNFVMEGAFIVSETIP